MRPPVLSPCPPSLQPRACRHRRRPWTLGLCALLAGAPWVAGAQVTGTQAAAPPASSALAPPPAPEASPPASSAPAPAAAAPEAGPASPWSQAWSAWPAQAQRIATAPWGEDRQTVARAALGVAGLVLLDKPLTRAWQQHVEKPLQGFHLPEAPGPLRHVGTGGTDGWLALGVAGTWLGGWALGDAQAERTGLAAGQAMVWSVVVSELLLKTVTGRKRPQDPWHPETDAEGAFTDDPWDFGHRRATRLPSGPMGTSMPSFHVTVWFAVAKVYADSYDSLAWPYGLLVLGLASDIQSHRHWVSDMVAGALIGTGLGAVVRPAAQASGTTRPGGGLALRLDGQGRPALAWSRAW
ncbi:phosphatase PAP2 family protein [Ideonella livida]|uniref:Phosphatase PAP2 family protein n=1 Tax=Ideonella livida TaxID=2707176 RepID=A0A7C9PGX8_9BURK|nr:phosphatase PAP2 family protein [Ideonella livida]NDY91677.1 phosphatase PAP2 family protein [Ideonella livida]